MTHILIVDDSPTVQYVMTSALQEYGLTVTQATNGVEALDLAKSIQPSLIILDVILPKKSGFQVCRSLKSDADTKHIPVIMLTSKNRETDRDWGLEQGADAYLIKPVEANALVELVNNLLNGTDTKNHEQHTTTT